MKIPMQMGGAEAVATGITGVTAYKNGNIATVIFAFPNAITVSSQGWHVLGTLPQELRPSTALRFVGFDNSATSYATSPALEYLIYTNGDVAVYFYNDKLKMNPHGTVTYITD